MTATTCVALSIALACFSNVIAHDAQEHNVLAETLQRQKMDLEKIDEAVEMCCPLENSDCCRHSLLFHQPINCTGLHAYRRIHTVECIEEYLFGNEHRPLVRDRICCEAFGDNDNDKDDVCRSLCNTVAMTPSLPPRAKHERTRHCKMANHGLHGCFDHCLSWRKNHVDVPWKFEEHCSVEYTMETNKKYILFENSEID